jgi:hypothetical protein
MSYGNIRFDYKNRLYLGTVHIESENALIQWLFSSIYKRKHKVRV